MMKKISFWTTASWLLGSALAACGGAPVNGAVDAMAQQPDGAAAPRFLTRFDAAAGELPESLAWWQDTLFVGLATRSQVWRMSADGVTQVHGTLPEPPAGQGFLTGMAAGPDGTLYVGLASFADGFTPGIYRLAPGGGEATLFASAEGTAFINGVIRHESGDLFVTDSGVGAVYRVSPAGEMVEWARSELLAGGAEHCPPEELPFAIGANGLVIDAAGDLVVMNTDRGSVVRIPVLPDGGAGTPAVIAGPDCGMLEGADGVVLDAGGNLIIAVNRQDRLVVLSPAGELAVLAEGGDLDFPADLVFGEGDHAGTLFVANFALGSASTEGAVARPGIMSLRP